MTPALRDFEGCWRIDRQIDDRLAGQAGALRGEAVFSAQGDGLRYDETGTLRLAGQPALEARQSYFWRQAACGIAVSFADGRPFHTIDLPGAHAAASHHCPPDTYLVRYDFSAWPEWSSIWTVTGPRKTYVMRTRYSRA